MLHINILCVGKIKEKYLREGVAEYQKRLGAYTRLKVIELSDQPLGKEPEKARKLEGEKILSSIKEGSYVAALDPGGKSITSEELATWLSAREMEGKEVYLVIGGATGLSPSVLNRADERMSFSNLTFPHQLFRLILVEQIYRGFKILRGEKYHY